MAAACSSGGASSRSSVAPLSTDMYQLHMTPEPGPEVDRRQGAHVLRRAGGVTVLVRAVVGPGVDHGLRGTDTDASRRRFVV